MRFPYLGVARLNYLYAQSVKRKLKQRAIGQPADPQPIQAREMPTATDPAPIDPHPESRRISALR